MKVIFLDFDGVLNTEKYICECGEYGVVIAPSAMAILKRIIDKTKAKIVLSTSWREHWSKNAEECDSTGKKINEIFSLFGMTVFDKTGEFGSREEEIEAWLKLHPETENFVVVDDRFLSSDTIKNHFVKVSGYKRGLDETALLQVLEILK